MNCAGMTGAMAAGSVALGALATAAACVSGVPSGPGVNMVPLAPRDDKEKPLSQLSQHLIRTYNDINANYYKKRNLAQDGLFPRKKKNGVAAKGNEEKTIDDYQFEGTEELFHGRYKVYNKKLGTGSFGQVLEAVDIQTGMEVAVKIVKKKKNFTSQAQTEINILEGLHSTDHTGRQYIVQLLDSFMHKDHQCLVFERLESNLYELLKKTQFNGVSLKLLRKLTRQILLAMEYLAHPNVNVVHCDLKPENILLVHPSRSQLKVIDFGSSCLTQKQMYQYIQSRFYRSPEVLLGIKYTPAIDMWSLACIMVEMHTGKPLFGGTDQYDMLRRITNVLGMPPREMIDRANPTFRRDYFDEIIVSEGETRLTDYRLKLRKTTSSSSSSARQAEEPSGPITLAEILGVETGGPGGRRLNKTDHTVHDYRLLLDLLQKMLDFNPATRITPTEALKHPFITAYALVEAREKKSKLLRSTQMRGLYSSTRGAASTEPHSEADETNMKVKQRRLYDTRNSIH